MSNSVYLVTNSANGKLYVGKTKHGIRYRWSKHLDAALNRGSPYAIHRAIRNYGKAAFRVSLLAEYETEELALKGEIAWIDRLQTMQPSGYNMCKGGRGVIGYAHRPDSIAKMQDACVGRTPSKACLDRSREVRSLGLSAEARVRMTEGQRLRRATTEATDAFRETMRKIAFARPPPKPVSDETRAKQSAGITAAWARRKEAIPIKLCSVCSQPVGRGGKGLCKKHYDAERHPRRKKKEPLQ